MPLPGQAPSTVSRTASLSAPGPPRCRWPGSRSRRKTTGPRLKRPTRLGRAKRVVEAWRAKKRGSDGRRQSPTRAKGDLDFGGARNPRKVKEFFHQEGMVRGG